MCNFIQKWWHNRLRTIDVFTLLPVFQLKVLQQIENGKQLDLDQTVDKMFDLHKSLPGQKHWNCACSRGE